MKDITKIGNRRFVIPATANSAHLVTEEAEQLIDFSWPDNKKIRKHLLDALKELRIVYRLSKSDDQLFVRHSSPEAIKQMLLFKMRTVNHAYTHFVSIPLYHSPDLQEAFFGLKQDALDFLELGAKSTGHKSRLFIDENKLHLTVCMLTLLSEADVKMAKDIVDSIQIGGLRVTLKGLDIIKGTPDMARVLVAKVDEETWDRLNAFNKIRLEFLKHSLTDAIDPILWHCTLINSKYYERFYSIATSITFDARKLLRKHTFGPITVSAREFHLSSLTVPSDSTGFYHSVHKNLIGGNM